MTPETPLDPSVVLADTLRQLEEAREKIRELESSEFRRHALDAVIKAETRSKDADIKSIFLRRELSNSLDRCRDLESRVHYLEEEIRRMCSKLHPC